jgi:hypothetical protein
MRVNTAGRTRHRTKVARPPHTTSAPRNREATPKPTPAHVKQTGTCPNCEGVGRLTVELRRDGRGYWVNCWDADCRALGGAYLRVLAEAVGAPGGGNIKDNAPYWLADYLEDERSVVRAEPPTSADVAGYASCLWTDAGALDYLMTMRGLTERTIRRARVGWDLDAGAFVFPVFNAAGEPVNIVRRPWPGEHKPKYRTMAGRTKENGGVELYPHPLPPGSWLLIEGLADAWLLRQHGIPAVTGTHGVSTFLDEWLPLVRGRRVAVAFDVGVEREQANRVGKLREAGANAWGVNIVTLGLSDKEDLSDYMLSGGTADELLWFIKQERRRAA